MAKVRIDSLLVEKGFFESLHSSPQEAISTSIKKQSMCNIL